MSRRGRDRSKVKKEEPVPLDLEALETLDRLVDASFDPYPWSRSDVDEYSYVPPLRRVDFPPAAFPAQEAPVVDAPSSPSSQSESSSDRITEEDDDPPVRLLTPRTVPLNPDPNDRDFPIQPPTYRLS